MWIEILRLLLKSVRKLIEIMGTVVLSERLWKLANSAILEVTARGCSPFLQRSW